MRLPPSFGAAARATGARYRELLASPLPRLLDRLPRPMRLPAGPVLVAVPRAFQPRGDGFGPDVVFIGPCLEPRADEAEHPLLAELAAETRPIVLVALGSAFNHRPGIYRQCFRAVAGQPWRVVVAIGRRTDPAELGPPPGRVTVLPWAPQLRVLEHAAAFVSHGGMGSVQESLSAGVPLVLFPQMVEQRADARRVVMRSGRAARARAEGHGDRGRCAARAHRPRRGGGCGPAAGGGGRFRWSAPGCGRVAGTRGFTGAVGRRERSWVGVRRGFMPSLVGLRRPSGGASGEGLCSGRGVSRRMASLTVRGARRSVCNRTRRSGSVGLIRGSPHICSIEWVHGHGTARCGGRTPCGVVFALREPGP